MLQAKAKLRAWAIVEESLAGIRAQPGEPELARMLRAVRAARSWRDVFPGVASLQLDTEGSGLTISIRLTKGEGEPVHLVPEGTPGATVVTEKRVDELGFYSLGLNQLAEKLGLSPPKALALIQHLKLQDDKDCFKAIRIGSATFKRYSTKCLEHLREALTVVDMNKVWATHKPTGRKKAV